MSIRQILGLCDHKWKQIDKQQIVRFLPSERERSEHTVGYQYTLQCEKCGNIKKKNIV